MENHGKAKAKLILDFKDGLLKGGSEGPAIVPGKPEESLLLQTIRHEFEDLRMPRYAVDRRVRKRDPRNRRLTNV
ncbi:MAG: hypothetical protein O3A82_04645 [Verrucomicrobia bacterium]|nr:hypothetical protein [Verrucomicrobiota bacterium]MDA0722963.1 hypothetical protein [Verrucomicrobiota bacterium]MDA1046201.1 hypothetical protein [Verrucomicrobiota bacterium]